MHRSATQRVVESDDIEELPDSFEDDGQDLNRLHSMRGSLDIDHPMSSRHPSSIDDRSSISLTMTPTTRFLDQPVLIDMTKDAKSTTGSSQTVPGRRGSGTYHDFGASGRFRAGLGMSTGDDLVQLHYETPNLLWMSIATVVGIVTGSVLNNVDVDPHLETWIGVPGEMYTRVMECVALPLIFTSVTICVAHLFISTKTQSVLMRVLLLLVLAAFLATLVAMGVSFLMAPSFTRKQVPPAPAAKTMISLQCANHFYVSTKTLKCGA
ncbi:hypothetical protein Poli38472_012998 [Pythium oligandrum]|uniref:Amino acid transporter n=1 Tax=Pythium oligandrum TaxID=41045 RepID=A0A8K1CKG4_PYTOL|nr:hypothetical protein Poli38472_012998 [Pythium oligandrum]|eukprot:TMW64376.1 hypothetical protein Poli38472_012998 [Pythium oligandrum]